MTKFLSLLAVGILSACSVNRGTVENRPPVIEKGSLKAMDFGVTYGAMKPIVISVLLWPVDWTEKQTEDNVRTINTYSLKFDDLIVETTMIPMQIENMYVEFMTKGCIEKFRKPAAEGETPRDPADYRENEDVDWVESVPAEQELDFRACKNNENYRRERRKRADVILQRNDDLKVEDNLPFVSEKIDQALGIENKVPVSVEGSIFKILPSATGPVVELTFKDFNKSGVSQSTMKERDLDKKSKILAAIAEIKAKIAAGASGEELALLKKSLSDNQEAMKPFAKFVRNASIDTEGHLAYTVPDMKSELILAGDEYRYVREYAFDLYRVANLLKVPMKAGEETATDIAKFKGDVRVLENGEVVRQGSGQLMGPLVGTPAAKN